MASPDAPPTVPGMRGGSTAYQDSGSIENEYYQSSFNLWTAEMTSLKVKNNNWEALAGPANVVAREPDGGDFWELYGTLNGARFTAMTKEEPLPPIRASLSSENVGGGGSTRNGAAVSEFRITHHFGAHQFSTTVRM